MVENQVDVEAIKDDVIEGDKEGIKYDGIKIVEPFATLLGVDENTIGDICGKPYANHNFRRPDTGEMLWKLTGNWVTLVRNISPNNDEQTFYFNYKQKLLLLAIEPYLI